MRGAIGILDGYHSNVLNLKNAITQRAKIAARYSANVLETWEHMFERNNSLLNSITMHVDCIKP